MLMYQSKHFRNFLGNLWKIAENVRTIFGQNSESFRKSSEIFGTSSENCKEKFPISRRAPCIINHVYVAWPAVWMSLYDTDTIILWLSNGLINTRLCSSCVFNKSLARKTTEVSHLIKFIVYRYTFAVLPYRSKKDA